MKALAHLDHLEIMRVTTVSLYCPSTCLSHARVWLCHVLLLKNSNYSNRLAIGLPLFPLFPLLQLLPLLHSSLPPTWTSPCAEGGP